VATHYDALVLLNFGSLGEFTEWAGGRTAVRQTVKGLGDAAFIGPQPGAEPTTIAFRKGPRAVRLTTTKVGEDGRRVVTMAQLEEIATLIESRLE